MNRCALIRGSRWADILDAPRETQ